MAEYIRTIHMTIVVDTLNQSFESLEGLVETARVFADELLSND